MANEDFCTMLYDKYSTEQEKYREWLLSQPPEEILNHTYEYTVRQDILCAVENGDITDKIAAALLRKDIPLSEVYERFRDTETDYMDVIRDTITSEGNAVLREEYKLLHSPVYPHDAAYAAKHDELEAYRASYHTNVACKKAIEDAINGNYKDWSLDSKSALAQVTELFSMERIAYVLAATVRHKDWDGRISDTNKAWAKSVPVCDEQDTTAFVVDKAHPGLTDLFLNEVRKESAQPQRKPSVMEKLKAAPVKNAPKISANSKGQER